MIRDGKDRQGLSIASFSLIAVQGVTTLFF
jgi:hypothetical protein